MLNQIRRVTTLVGLCIGSSLVRSELAADTSSAADIGVSPRLVWKFTTSAPIVSSPIISESRIYFGGQDSLIYCLDLLTGRPVWKLNTGGQIRSTPTVKNGVVYCVGGVGALLAIRAHTGELVWRFGTEGEHQQDFADYYQSSPTISGDILYFGSADNRVYAVRAGDGSLVWKYQTGGVVHAKPAVDSDRVYVGSFDGYFYALDKKSGALVWKFKSVGQQYFPTGEFSGSPTVYGGLVFVGARDYNLYALDKDKGHCRWNKAFSRGWALPNVIHDTILYIGTSDDRLLIAVNPETGSEIWRRSLGFNIFGGMAATDSVGYVGTLMGKLFAIDLRTGAIVWTFTTDGYAMNHLKYFKPDDTFRDDIFEIVKSNEAFVDVEHELGAIFSTPAISDGYLIVTATDGAVYAFRLR